MKIEVTSGFRDKLKRQIQYISKDKPQAARNFNQLVFQEIRKLADNLKKNRKSIFFDNDNIRDVVVKGYLIVFEIVTYENKIVVFGFYKWENNL